MMRIEKLLLKNFRQYKDLEFLFPKSQENDLHIIIGKNGMGKTTLLNAINWCLYGEEPHASESTSKLPLLNLSSVEKSINDYQEVLVELWVTDNDNNYTIFQRTQPFRILSNNNFPIPQTTEFRVTTQDKIGNTIILEGEEAEIIVDRFVPYPIKEFFFFDGERLDNYFKDVKGTHIKHQIFILSHVFLLENMASRLGKIFKSLRREAGKLNPDIDVKTEELENLQKRSKTIDSEIVNTKKQIKLANDQIKYFEENLRDTPDVNTLDLRRNRLNTKKKTELDILAEKNSAKKKFLLDSLKIINLWPSIEKAIYIIKTKRRNREIPPTIDKELLEKILIEEDCKVCGRHLDNDSKERVKSLLDTIKLSSTVVTELHEMEHPLLKYKESINSFMDYRLSIQKDIQHCYNRIEDIDKEITEIDKKLSGHDEAQIKAWHKERTVLEEANELNLIKLGSLKEQLKINVNKIKKLRKELDILIKNEEKAKKIKRKLAFTSKALDVVLQTKEAIMKETKRLIEFETKKIFFELLWKKATFKDVKIDEDYSVNLIHSMGYDCLGSCSAAERELLALSFTLALHRISGFESPILIDTPVARVSDEHRTNFADIFLDVSKNKQIILMFTPAEFSDDIRDILLDKIRNKFVLDLKPGEKEVIMGAL